MKVYCYTITRASSPERAKLLLETLTRGRDTAAHPFTWHVHVNGPGLGQDVVESCLATKIIDTMEVTPTNVGQHPPANKAIAHALAESYDYLLRLDDDVEFLTKRWLAKLVESSKVLGDKMVLSPQVLGLRWLPPLSQLIEYERVPLKIIEGPIGGVCRLTPIALLREKPYTSDVRLPMGGGDAAGVWGWAQQPPITPLAYLQHVRVRHAKSTNVQEKEDPFHFKLHDLYQFVPYIPPYVPR